LIIPFYRYLRYVVRHKWYVFLACCGEGIWWRGLIHDLSKFYWSEFIPYAEHFCTTSVPKRDPYFDFAWLLHQKRNRHHWQWWLLANDNGDIKVFPMSKTARLEMVCDWYGAGLAQGKKVNKEDKWSETREWFLKNQKNIILSPETERWVMEKLGCTVGDEECWLAVRKEDLKDIEYDFEAGEFRIYFKDGRNYSYRASLKQFKLFLDNLLTDLGVAICRKGESCIKE